ncbi:MAG: hypothetical protein KAS39_01640, partial [Actinomycetia bacterium]|nr:hypothetical protein [Actinomycetes bacterium]
GVFQESGDTKLTLNSPTTFNSENTTFTINGGQTINPIAKNYFIVYKSIYATEIGKTIGARLINEGNITVSTDDFIGSFSNLDSGLFTITSAGVDPIIYHLHQEAGSNPSTVRKLMTNNPTDTITEISSPAADVNTGVDAVNIIDEFETEPSDPNRDGTITAGSKWVVNLWMNADTDVVGKPHVKIFKEPAHTLILESTGPDNMSDTTYTLHTWETSNTADVSLSTSDRIRIDVYGDIATDPSGNQKIYLKVEGTPFGETDSRIVVPLPLLGGAGTLNLNSAASLAPVNVKFGRQGVPFMRLDLQATGGDVTWQGLTLKEEANPPWSGYENASYTNISTVTFYYDSNTNGFFDSSDTQITLTGSNSYTVEQTTFTFQTAEEFTNGQEKTYFITYDINNSITLPGGSGTLDNKALAGLRINQASDFVVAGAGSVSASILPVEARSGIQDNRTGVLFHQKNF